MHILRGCLGLTIEDSRRGDLVATDMLGDLLKGELFGGFGAEESMCGLRQIGVLSGLEVYQFSFGVVVYTDESSGWRVSLTSRVARSMANDWIFDDRNATTMKSYGIIEGALYP